MSLVVSKKQASKKKKQSAPKGTVGELVRAPAAIGRIVRSDAGTIMTTGRMGGVTIKRREFVGTTGNGNVLGQFVLDAESSSSPGWDFNPGNGVMFPWLSHIAASYEKYRFEKLKFELVSAQSTNVPGRVYMAVDYDWDDQVPTSLQQMMGNATASEGPMWQGLSIEADCREMNRDMPFRFVNVAGRVDAIEQRTCMAGFLLIGFYTTNSDNRFDLWVDYEVKLEIPTYENRVPTFSSPDFREPTPPYVEPGSPWYSGSGANHYFVQAMWTANQILGRVREVVSGVGDVPLLTQPTADWTTGWLGRGLDVARTGNNQYIEFVGHARETEHGVTPQTWIEDGWPFVNVYAHNALGTYLGQLAPGGVPNTGVHVPEFASATDYADPPTVGGWAMGKTMFKMGDLRKLFPTLRYLVPVLMVAKAFTAVGNGDSGINYAIY